MKRINILMACAALTMAFTGCDDEDDPIVLVDSGMTATDAGMTDPGTEDAGTDPDPDAGTTEPSVCGSVDLSSGTPPLPDSCVPRCSAETITAINACVTAGGTNEQIAMCQQMATEADTTPEAILETGGGMTETLTCAACWEWAQLHCIMASCGAEIQACSTCGDGCNPATPGCEDEEAAFMTCQVDNDETIQTCFNDQAMRCF